MKRVTLALAIMLCVVSAVAVSAQHPRESGTPTVVPAVVVGPGSGTVVYDPGAPADFFTNGDAANDIFGNVFDTSNGNPLMSGMITALTSFPQPVGTSIFMTVMAPPVGGTAPILAVSIAGIGAIPNTFNQFPVTVAVGSSFLAGQYLGTFNGPDSVGVRSASTNGQGFHGFQINFVGATVATGFAPLQSQNVMFRVSGTIIPVELMSFDVE